MTIQLFLLLSILFPSACLANYNIAECLSLVSLNISLFDYDQYPVYFHENSTMTVLQTGTYTGPEGIEEYVRIADDANPYVSTKTTVATDTQLLPEEFNPETGECVARSMLSFGFQMNPELTDGSRIFVGTIFKFYFSIPQQKIDRANGYFKPALFNHYFGSALDSDAGRGYVCDVLTRNEGCEETRLANDDMDHETCMRRLKELPMNEGDESNIDGFSQGCRFLHSVLADSRPLHCPHLSFVPLADENDEIKCHESENPSFDDLFTQEDLEAFHRFCESRPELNNSAECFVELPPPAPVSDTPETSSTLQVEILGGISAATLATSLLVVFDLA